MLVIHDLSPSPLPPPLLSSRRPPPISPFPPDWMRIGAFSFDSPAALLTENLNEPLRIPKVEKILQLTNWTLDCCLFGALCATLIHVMVKDIKVEVFSSKAEENLESFVYPLKFIMTEVIHTSDGVFITF
ncbi:hypothetical protein OROMI_032855 [Orobanche minor]